jgi:hypothetical protein
VPEYLGSIFLTSVPTIKEILQRELGLKNSRGVAYPIFCPRLKKSLMLKR